MEKANTATFPSHTLTSEEISLLELISERNILEDITLIFPWGSSPLSLKRSSNYLQYCMDLPKAAMELAILRLLGIRPYRTRKSFHQFTNPQASPLFSSQEVYTKRTGRPPIGTEFTKNT